MEKTTTVLKSSTRIAIIAVIILILIFLSFFMVTLVPRILSSMANSTVSITSAFFPANKPANNLVVTSTSTGITLDTQSTTNTTSSSSSTKGDFLSNFFGPRKEDPSTQQPVNFSIATSTRQNYNNTNNAGNNNTNVNANTNYQRPVGYPDLSVQITSIGNNGTNGVFVSKNNFTTTDTVIVKFKIENQGNTESGPWSMKVVMPSSNVNDQIKTISAKSIPAGAAISGQAVFNTPAVGSGQQVTITVDPNGSITESNKNNNTASVALSVTQANYNYNYNSGYNYNGGYNNYNGGYNYNYNCVNGYTNGIYTNCNNNYNGYNNNIPNLTATFVALGKIDIYNQFTQTTYLRTSEKVAVKFQVTNNSSVYASSWSWKAQLVGLNTYNNYNNNYYNNYNNGYTYNSDGSRTYTTLSPESGLAPGETRTYTVTFDNLTYGTNYLTINVDSLNNIVESNESDNVISQSFFVNY